MSLPAQQMLELSKELSYPNGFWPWLEDNEHIYKEFVQLALQMRRTGRTGWSARAIIHVLRWNTALRSKGDIFKINNNYTSGISRLAMKEFPELHGFFELRESNHTVRPHD